MEITIVAQSIAIKQSSTTEVQFCASKAHERDHTSSVSSKDVSSLLFTRPILSTDARAQGSLLDDTSLFGVSESGRSLNFQRADPKVAGNASATIHQLGVAESRHFVSNKDHREGTGTFPEAGPLHSSPTNEAPWVGSCKRCGYLTSDTMQSKLSSSRFGSSLIVA